MASIEGAMFSPFRMEVVVQQRVQAYIYILPEDREKTLYTNEEFEVEGRYIIGDPSVLDIPFEVLTSPVGEYPFPKIEIISVEPRNPVVYGVDASTEQVVKVKGIARSSEPENAGLSPSQGTRVRFELVMFQPDLNQAVTARHSGADGVIPNVSSRNIGNSQEITWESPVDDDGNIIGVDVKVDVSVYDSEGNLNRLGSEVQTFEAGDNSLTIDYPYLNDIVADNGGFLSSTQRSLVVVSLKPDSEGTFFNRDGAVILNFLAPFTTRGVYSDELSVDLVQKTRLGGDTYLAFEFYAVARRAEDIDVFEYRYRRWTEFPSATPDNPFPQPDEFPFSEWSDATIRTRSRFIDVNGRPTRGDVEYDSTRTYLGPYGFHAEASPGGLEPNTQYIIEARTVDIRQPNADRYPNTLQAFNVIARV